MTHICRLSICVYITIIIIGKTHVASTNKSLELEYFLLLVLLLLLLLLRWVVPS